MGGTVWSYFVPYQSDINKALQELKEKAFAEGDYYAPDWTVEDCEEFLSELEAQHIHSEITEDEYNEEKRRLEIYLNFACRGGLSTIEELHQWVDDSGAYSILDIEKASDKPKDFQSMREMFEQRRAKPLAGGALNVTAPSTKEEWDLWNQTLNTIYPLSDQDLLDVFETLKPTRSIVEAYQSKIERLLDSYDRYTGFYFVVYKDDSPDEIFIHGFSGD